VLPRLQEDIVPIFLQIAQGHLQTKTLNWDTRPCLSVVLASGGYPEAYKTGFPISGLGEVQDPDIMVFHAGTSKAKSGEIVTSGGRVLAVSALGATMRDAQQKAYGAIEKIQFEGRHFRRDIGKRVLNNAGAARK
jgi:phosphoribosylamine--glycine ligase